MISRDQGAFKNYYEVLGVAENASTEAIQQAYQVYYESQVRLINNPGLMKSARYALNEILPAIQQNLLDGHEKRAEYDRQLAAFRQSQTQQLEIADDAGLDIVLRNPFFFDPYKDYDTETYALTIRDIAAKFDEEWEKARTCITDRSDDTHVLVGFLNYSARRERLAQRVERIVEAATNKDSPKMNTNEAVERCIYILNPRIERPTISVQSPHFDGRALEAGSFVADMPARTTFTLHHEGLRGCAFGSIESRTSWATFSDGQSSMYFSLMPEGTHPTIGSASIAVTLEFEVRELQRNAMYSANLIVRLDNYEPAKEYLLQVNIYISSTPPRVTFTPPSTAESPVLAKAVRRGLPTSVVVTAQNVTGDEALVPLTARLVPQDPYTSVRPNTFHTGDAITLTIDTTYRPFGKPFHVVYTVDYSSTPGAQGVKTVHVAGDILPTWRQSLFREKNATKRMNQSWVVGLCGMLLFGAIGAGLQTHIVVWWLLLSIMPFIFLGYMHTILTTYIVHKQRAGDALASKVSIPVWLSLGIPLGAGLVPGLLSMLFSDISTAIILCGIIGLITSSIFAFLTDKAEITAPVGTSITNQSLPGNTPGTPTQMKY